MPHIRRSTAQKPRTPAKAGFTAIEMVMTVGLMSMTAGLVVPMVREYQMYTDIDTASQHLVQAIRTAELQSQSGKFDTAWGVYVPDGILFAGESYALRNDDHDSVFVIPQNISIHGPTELSFARITGFPKNAEDICIESEVSNGHRILSMDQYGLVTTGPVTGGDCEGNGIVTPTVNPPDAGSPAEEPGTGDAPAEPIIPPTETNPTGEGGNIPCYIRFALDPTGGTLMTAGTNDITVKVLNANGTYGAGGPAIRVRGSVSLDNGTNWTTMNNGEVLSGGEELRMTNVMQGTPLAIKIEGRYSWLFNKTVRSDEQNGRIIVLRNGDQLPAYAALQNRTTLPASLQPLIDSAGKVAIDRKSLLFLTELDTLDRTLSDFRDAIILVTFEEKAGTCTDGAKPTVKISFDRLENMGTGDATDTTFAGPGRLPFTPSQSIPLVDENGEIIVDGGLVKNVQGLALERGDGWLRIVSYGSHQNSSGKEVIDAMIRLENATITEIQNDTGADASEFPSDGQTDDTSSGDEFVPATDKKTVLFRTRVITDNDGIYIRWLPDAILAATESIHAAAQTPAPVTIDPCSVPFTIDEGGIITPEADAELTIRMLGVHAVAQAEGSPLLDVRAMLSTDGGGQFSPLWGNRVLAGNETTSFPRLPAGRGIALGFTGRYSWTVNRSVTAGGNNNDALRVVKSGDSLEELRMAAIRGTLPASLRNLVDRNGTLLLGPRDIAYLVDMGDALPRTYQDVIAVVTVEKSSHGNDCLTQNIDAGETSSGSSSLPVTPVPIVDADGDSIADQVDLCPGTIIPEPTPSNKLLLDRFALTTFPENTTVPAGFGKGPKGVQGEYTVADTRGCSCTQILDAVASPSATKLSSEPVLYRQIKNLFPFYVDTSRKYGCTKALLKIVAGH
jgi:type II secretory pathway pseudopilin PulG